MPTTKKSPQTTTAAASSNAFPPPLAPSTVEQRLWLGTASTGGSRGSLPRCATKYRAFLQAFSQEQQNADAIETSKQDLEREVSLYQVELTKLVLKLQVAQDELNTYDASLEQVQENITTSQEEILQLRRQHERTLEVRRNKEEYEALAQLAHHRPSSHQQTKTLEALKAQQATVEQQEERAQDELHYRQAQFQLLCQCLLDLKSSIVPETTTTLSEEGETPTKAGTKQDSKQQDVKDDDDDEEEEGLVEMDTS